MRKLTKRNKLIGGWGLFVFFCACAFVYGDEETQSGKYDPVMYVEDGVRAPCIDYDLVGVIENVQRDNKTIIIDDRLFRFAPKISFHSPDSMDISIHNLRPGKKVGIILNEKDELASVCILKN